MATASKGATRRKSGTAPGSAAGARALPDVARDRLADAAERAGLDGAALGRVRAWLGKLVEGDQFAKLEQGGHVDGGIPLRRVFVDLPVSGHGGEAEDADSRGLFVARLHGLSPRPLSMATSIPSVYGLAPEHREAQEPFGFIVIGGPGQGKSTLGQFACQLHRAALLAPARAALPETVRRLTADLVAAREDGQPALSGDAMFPLRIVLPDAAAWLATRADVPGGGAPAFLRFLASRASAQEAGLTADMLAALVPELPALIVLDGLDEVGAPEDRDRLITASRELFAMLAAREACALVVATTRPQGYSGELERLGLPLATVHLTALSVDEALAYAKKLLAEKIPDADELDRCIGQMREAAREPATAHLLRTPLQVTILAALVQQIGRAPSERWRLFNDYFDTLFKREIARGTFASELLSKHRTHIVEIHERVGLLLQVESEAAGGSAARLSQERLATVADTVLGEDDVAPEDRARLVRDIVKAAAERLVFLVEPEPGSFGFEIRSLQELMAARALTADTEATILEERLQEVAKSGTFRNTLLFAASRLFSEGSRYRDLFAARICPALDADPTEPLAVRTKAGATLALDLLEEGSVEPQPKRARALMERAVGLLDLPPCDDQRRLARVVTRDTEAIVRDAAAARLTAGGDAALGAWVCVIEATRFEAEWAKTLGDRFLAAVEDASPVLSACKVVGVPLTAWLAKKVEERPEAFRPAALLAMGEDEGDRGEREGASWVRLIAHNSNSIRGTRIAVPGLPLSFRSVAAKPDLLPLARWDSAPALWQPWVAWAKFETAPSAETLARMLRLLSGAQDALRYTIRSASGWPLHTCIQAASSNAELEHLANALDEGSLGDFQEWKQAEDAWARSVEPSAWIRAAKGPVPWDRGMLPIAPPILAVELVARHYSGGQDSIRALIDLARACIRAASAPAVRARWAELGWSAIDRRIPGMRSSVPAPELLTWAEASFPWRPSLVMDAFEDANEWLAWLDRKLLEDDHWFVEEPLVPCLQKSPERSGLLRGAAWQIAFGLGYQLRTDWPDLPLMLARHPWPTPSARAQAAIIRLALTPDESEVDELAEAIAGDPDSIWMLLALVDQEVIPPPVLRRLLLRLDDLLSAPALERAQRLQAMRRLLQSRRSGLASEATWRRLGLPAPLPVIPRPGPGLPALPRAPVVLQSFEVRHVLGFAESVHLDLAAPEEGKGQWIALVGPNGVGKTTLLRSLVLALRDLSNPKIWPKGAFAASWHSNRVAPETPALLRVQLATGETFETRIRSNGSDSFQQVPSLAGGPLFPIFAYGCRRGSALGGIQRAVDLGEDDGPEVATLFAEGAPLIHAETWLKDWHGAALESPSGPNATVFKSVVTALCALLDLQSIVVENRTVLVSGKPVGERVPFSVLSDGYLTMAGWYLDLVARWVELAQRYKAPLGADFLKDMRGLVLLDEIDVHIHPEWQIDVIPRIRDLMPGMSFVITTHNPLTLVGARPEEIFRLSWDDGRVRVTRGTESPELLTSAQILSQYFGIERLFPSAVGEKLQRYGFLSGYALRNDEEQATMERLRRELQEAGVDPGWEEVPRRPLPSEQVTSARPRKRTTSAPAKPKVKKAR